MGLELYGRFANAERPNLIFSPAGAAHALAIIEAGSAGATRAELLATLNGGGTEDGLQLAVATALAADGLTSSSQVTVFGQIEVLSSFKQAAHRLGAGIVAGSPTSGSAAANPPSVRATVVTQLRFGGSWEHPLLDRVVAPSPFVRLDGERIAVPTMRLRARLRCAEVAGVTLVELPYRGRRYSMLLARPDTASPPPTVSPETLSAWLDALEPRDVELSLPRFSIGPQRHQLEGSLSELGIARLFDADRADLSRFANLDRPIWVASVAQNARVEVDEHGTQAEATTTVAVVDAAASPPDLVVLFDRPFFFILRDNRSGLIIFLGRVADPASTSTVDR